MPLKYLAVKSTLQNYPHLKNLNIADSGTRSGEIDVMLDSHYLWKFVSGKVNCGTGHEPRGTDKVFGYVLSDPFVNIEGIKMNHRKVAILTSHTGGWIRTVAMKLAIITVHLRGII